MMITSQATSAEQPEILTTIEGNAGVITLNRPKALNALSLSMIQDITRALMEWRDESRVRSIIVKSNSEKAFCAGGDVRSVYEAKLQGDDDYLVDIFREEYLLNYLISVYPKPYIALINGICMGGGLGISVHGSHRIVTERANMAMPEANIGFFPDIGSSYFLNRCPGEIGAFLGVLGESISGEDALYAGLATHRIDSSELSALYQALLRAESHSDVDDILQDAAGGQQECLLQSYQPLINRCFSYTSVEEIFEALQRESDSLSGNWLKASWKKSPTSLKLALAVLRRSKGMSLKDVLALDFMVSQHCVKGHDFFEGVRALLVDKDNNPRWQPARLSDVTLEMVEGYFAPVD